MVSYFHFFVAEDAQAAPYETHYHGDYEVYYLTEGRCRYFVGSKTYHINPGDMVLIPPGVIHNVLYDSATHSRMLIKCTEDYIPTAVRKRLEGTACFSANPETALKTERAFVGIRDAYASEDDLREDTLRYHALGLFLIMAKAAVQPRSTSTLVEKAVEYIQSHYSDRVTLKETAWHCAVCAEHLSRVFKKETGFGFGEYLNLYRLKKAEALLRSGSGKTVTRIATDCGFSDSNYFSVVYKKFYGIPPSQAKKQTEQEY